MFLTNEHRQYLIGPIGQRSRSRRKCLKSFKFLIPVGVAAATLIGGQAKAELKSEPVQVVQQQRTSDLSAPEQTLLMKVTDQGVMYAQHESHASHGSHGSHGSHRSGF